MHMVVSHAHITGIDMSDLIVRLSHNYPHHGYQMTVTWLPQCTTHLEDTSPMALELADLTGQPVPGHSVEGLPTDVAVGGAGVSACKPAVLSLKVLQSLQHALEREGEGERGRVGRREGEQGWRQGGGREGMEGGRDGRREGWREMRCGPFSGASDIGCAAGLHCIKAFSELGEAWLSNVTMITLTW